MRPSSRLALRVLVVAAAAAAGASPPELCASAPDSVPEFARGYPTVLLANRELRMTVFLPDPERGYYRGTRFDWSGVIGRIEWRGHRFYGEWRGPHDPTNHDDITGPSEEFGMAAPLGYAEARPGETFLKIGVGWLEKVAEPEYRFWFNYPARRAATWQVRHGADWIEFRQEVSDPRGWGYRYTKRVSLEGDGPRFAIAHRLRNTGARPIETDHYNHNFTLIDEQPVGPDYVVTLPFAAPERRALAEFAEVTGREIRFLRDVPPDGSVFAELRGLTGTARNHQATVLNRRAGVGIRFRGDQPLLKYNFWSARLAACPEPFIGLRLAAGGETAWRTRYELFAERG